MSDGSKKFYFLLRNHMALYKGANKVAGSAGAGFSPENAGTTGQVLKKTSTGYNWDAESGAVTSVNGQTGAVTVSEFSPSSSGTTGQYLKKTAGGYDWDDVSGGDVLVSSQANNILTSGMKIWAGTQANYEALDTYDNNTVYLTI